MNLEVRSEVIEYGALPQCPWLAQVESLQHIKEIMVRLLQSATCDDQGRSFVTPDAISAVLDTNSTQTKVLVDLLAALVEPPDLVQVPEGSEDAVGVEVYALGLYLVAQFYLREAHKADTADTWPSELFSLQQEPSSPMHMTARAWGREQSPAHRAHLPMMRQHLQEHLVLQEALLQGFSGFIAKHAAALVALVLNPQPQAQQAQQQQQQQQPGSPLPPSPSQLQPPPPSPASPHLPAQPALPSSPLSPRHRGQAPGPPLSVTPAELDRLGFLLRPPQPLAQPPEEEGGAAGPRRAVEGGSPMDVCGTPFTDACPQRLSEHSPFFGPQGVGGSGGGAPAEAVAAWIAESLRQDSDMADMSGGSPRSAASVFNQLVSVSSLALPTDIQGVSKATVVRGEGDFPSSTLRVLNCHDAVIYALAPLQYTLVSACSDCVVVVGAVGRALRIERCERVQVIAAARHAAINTCHDCIFYLGVNQRPAALGDNRFLQLAPYNAGYDRLPEHMAIAGVRAGPNLWDVPASLLPDHRKHHHELLHEAPGGGGGGSTAGASPSQRGLASPVLQQPALGHAAGSGAGGAAAAADAGPSPMVLTGSGGGAGPAGGGDTPCGSPSLMSGVVGSGAGGSQGTPSSSSAAQQQQEELEEVALPSPVLGAPASVTLLPPGKLLPFLIPFVGGPGPLCGGPAKVSINIRASSDSLSGLMSMGEGSATFPSSPFGLPAAYVQAWEAKMRSAAEVRAAVKTANLDEAKKKELMSAIQAHFKEWLQQTGGMRQVYDLAKLERSE